MSIETDKFIFSNTCIKYTESNEIRGDRNRAAPIATGITSTDLLCKTCGHTWSSRAFGEGRFHAVLGALVFECPECKAEENVNRAKLMEV